MHMQVKTPSRLHLGLLDLNGNLGRIYGSVGLALSHPVILLEAKSSEELIVKGEEKDLLLSLIKKFSESQKIDVKAEIELREVIPPHVGLGSGTQLSLAVASCLSHIHGLSLSVVEMATLMGLGAISGIGTACFEHGGFIIDGGHKSMEYAGPPPVIFRHPFPKHWSFIVAIPGAGKGIYGEREERALKKMIPSPPEITAEVCRLVQMKMLPSLIEEDIEDFGRSLTEVDKRVGRYFKNVQEDIYSERICTEIMEFMLEEGSHGGGQSSWGPVVYGVIEDSRIKDLEGSVRDFLSEKNIRGQVFSTRANNEGARITIIED